MEEFERKIIRKNLPALIRVTLCNELLIAELKSRNVLSIADDAELTSTANWMAKNKMLYEILETRVDGFKHLKESLARTNQSGAVKILEESPDCDLLLNNSSPVSEPVFFNVDSPNHLFTGRREELKTLQKSLQEPGLMTVISSKSCITGLGGIGKTDLARKLIQNVCNEKSTSRFQYIIWINAENDLSASKDFKYLAANKLRIPILTESGREKDISVILDEIYERLALQKSLIIFDNVEDAEFIHKYFPKVPHSVSNIHILITSQVKDWEMGTHISLSGLEQNDAVTLVKKGLKQPNFDESDFDEDVLLLVTRLDFFPLAILQAIAYINEKAKLRKHYGPKEYTQDLDKNAANILKAFRPKDLTDYNKSTFVTLQLSLKRLNEKHGEIGQVAIKLIRQMSFLAHDIIEESIFEDLFEKNVFDDALLLLERFGIVNIVSKSDENSPLKIRIHRLVQHVMRCVLEVEEDVNFDFVLEGTLLLLQNKMTQGTVEHGISIWQHAAKFKHFISKHGSFPIKIFWNLCSQGRRYDALKFMKFALKSLSQHFKYEEDCDSFLEHEYCMCYILDHQMKKSDYVSYIQNVLHQGLKFKSKNYPTILKMRHLLIDNQNNLSHGEILNELYDIYNAWKLLLGNNENLESLNVLFDISVFYTESGETGISIAIFQKVLKAIKGIEKNFGRIEMWRIGELRRKAELGCAYAFLYSGFIEAASLLTHYAIAPWLEEEPEHVQNRWFLKLCFHYSQNLFFAGCFEESEKVTMTAFPIAWRHGIFSYELLYCMARLCSELRPAEAWDMASEFYEYFKKIQGESDCLTLRCLALKGKILSQMDKHKSAQTIMKVISQHGFLSGKLHPVERCFFGYSYIYSLVKTKDIADAKELVVPLKNMVSQMSDLFFIKPKLLKLYNLLHRQNDIDVSLDLESLVH